MKRISEVKKDRRGKVEEGQTIEVGEGKKRGKLRQKKNRNTRKRGKLDEGSLKY